MALIGWSLEVVLDDPMGELIVIEELPLPAVRKAVPEQAEHVSDDHCQ